MTPTWAQRREALLRDCIVSPDVFHQMVERLGDFVVPYQQVLETEVGQRHLPLYLEGLLSHLGRKNAETIAALVEVERQVIQDFIGTALWDHRPLVKVLVGQVVDQLGEPDGVIAFDPSSFPKRGTHSVGVKRQWCGHRGKVDNCQVASSWGTSLATSMLCSTSASTCLRSGHGTRNGARNVMCPRRYSITRDPSSVWRCSTSGVRKSYGQKTHAASRV